MNSTKFKYVFYVLILASAMISACDSAEHRLTLVNKTGRTLTIYRPRTIPFQNSDVFNAFAPQGAEKNYVGLSFFVNPYGTKRDVGASSFDNQFETTDGKLHVIILDADSLKSLAKNHLLDTKTINRAILADIEVSKDEMEKNQRTITYNGQIKTTSASVSQ